MPLTDERIRRYMQSLLFLHFVTKDSAESYLADWTQSQLSKNNMILNLRALPLTELELCLKHGQAGAWEDLDAQSDLSDVPYSDQEVEQLLNMRDRVKRQADVLKDLQNRVTVIPH